MGFALRPLFGRSRMEKVTETPVFVLHLSELFQILNQMLKHISLIYSYEKYYKHLQMTTVQIILTDYRLYNNVHEENYARLISWKRVQSWNTSASYK